MCDVCLRDDLQYILSLATQTNAVPLPAVPEVFGVRLPPPSECLTSVDFDLIPNRPPPDVKLYDEETEEIEEDEEDEDEGDEDDADMEPAPIPLGGSRSQSEDAYMRDESSIPPQPPLSTVQSPSGDVEMGATPAPMAVAREEEEEEEDEDGLFAGGDDEEGSNDEAMGATPAEGGVKRRLEEEEDYD